MKVNGSISPASSFTVVNDGGTAIISFYENAVQKISDDGNDTSWEWDEYTITRPYRETLEADIEANYNVWLLAAKAEDERRTPVDEYQLRADVDYQAVMLEVMSPISLMSVSSGSDPDVLEMARKYYPMRWNEDRLRVLVAANKLTSSDFESITGVPYSSEEIG